MTQQTVTELRVRYSETDQMGVVYHANYLIWCEIGRTDFIRSTGKPYSELEKDGVLLAVSEASLRYHASARYDDAIRVVTRLVEVRSRTVRFDYRIYRADNDLLLVSASTTLISLSSGGQLASMPLDVRTFLAAAVSSRFEDEP